MIDEYFLLTEYSFFNSFYRRKLCNFAYDMIIIVLAQKRSMLLNYLFSLLFSTLESFSFTFLEACFDFHWFSLIYVLYRLGHQISFHVYILNFLLFLVSGQSSFHRCCLPLWPYRTESLAREQFEEQFSRSLNSAGSCWHFNFGIWWWGSFSTD